MSPRARVDFTARAKELSALHDAGWSLGWVSAVDREGRTIWIVDAHRDGKRFIVCADEILSAFLELEKAIHEFAVSLVLKS